MEYECNYKEENKLELVLQKLLDMYSRNDFDGISKMLNLPEEFNTSDIFPLHKYEKGMQYLPNPNPCISVRVHMDEETSWVYDTLLIVMEKKITDRDLADILIRNFIRNLDFGDSPRRGYGRIGDVVSIGKCVYANILVGQKSWNDLLRICKLHGLRAKDGFKMAVLSYLDRDIEFDKLTLSDIDSGISIEQESHKYKNIEELKDGKLVLSNDVNINDLSVYMECRTDKDSNVINDSSRDCWKWTGNKGSKKYGHIQFFGYKGHAHRISYLLKNGYIPEGKFILHSCDTPDCVNPDHLRVGDQKDNTKDAINRGRIGNKNIFNKEQIAQIHELFDSGLNKSEIAEKLGYNRKQIDAVF